MYSVVRVQIDAADEHGRISRGSGNDDLLRTTLQVEGGILDPWTRQRRQHPYRPMGFFLAEVFVHRKRYSIYHKSQQRSGGRFFNLLHGMGMRRDGTNAKFILFIVSTKGSPTR